MRKNSIIVALLTLMSVTVINASPQFRLVSGERGVIFSVENVSSEPTIDVELIDGDLSVIISECDFEDSTFSETIILGEGYWADSVVSNSNDSELKVVFYNFSLPIEDMQKKYSNSRLILLLSQTVAKDFDKFLFLKPETEVTSVSSFQIISRDGLEFLTLSGHNLENVVLHNGDGSLLLQFPNGITYDKSQELPQGFLTQSIVSKQMGSGSSALEIIIDQSAGFLTFLESEDSEIKLTFTDTRERDNSTVEAFGDLEVYSYFLDSQRGDERTFLQPVKYHLKKKFLLRTI